MSKLNIRHQLVEIRRAMSDRFIVGDEGEDVPTLIVSIHAHIMQLKAERNRYRMEKHVLQRNLIGVCYPGDEPILRALKNEVAL